MQWISLKTQFVRHPEAPRFHQRGEGSGEEFLSPALDPLLRLKNGFAQDDAIRKDSKLSHYQTSSNHQGP
jgi:hypothetical protein